MSRYLNKPLELDIIKTFERDPLKGGLDLDRKPGNIENFIIDEGSKAASNIVAAYDPSNVQFQDDAHRHAAPPQLQPGQAVELARFVVLPGQTGLIKYIGTSLRTRNPQRSRERNSPFDIWLPQVTFRFFLRLYQTDTAAMMEDRQLTPLPYVGGFDHLNLQPWGDLRYLQNGGLSNVNLVIPPGFVARLYFVGMDATASIVREVSGQIKGQTWLNNDPDLPKILKKGWSM